MSEDWDALTFRSRIGKRGSVLVPVPLLRKAELGEGDYATFEIKPATDTGKETSHDMEVKHRLAEAEELGQNTFNAYLPLWLRSFRENLDLIPKDAKSFGSVAGTRKKTKGLVVGAGPSLADTDWDALAKFRGTIVASNKALVPLVENEIVPDWVVALDGSPEVYKSFDDPILDDHPGKVRFLGATVIDPSVTSFVLGWAKDCIWGNPDMPSGDDSDLWNINLVLELLNGMEVLRHGGNVGTTCWLLAKHLGCNPIAMLGFDMCFHPQDTWTKEDAIEYEFYYNPENKEIMALDSPFKAYLSILTDVVDMAWQEGVATLNLTPVGALHSSSLYPNYTIQRYCSKERKTIIAGAKKERGAAVDKMVKKIHAMKERAKPIFREEV